MQAKPRRHSNSDEGRQRGQNSKAGRPKIVRPKSAGDAHAFALQEESAVQEPVNSPTKGILLTPGTAAARRKTVTFGAHVTNNEEKRPFKSGLPDDCPGKFPSPWAKADTDEEIAEGPAGKGKGRSKLTEKLEQVRNESATRSRSDRRKYQSEEESMAKEFEEPKSESGRYWKMQYDIYRENSLREMKKLITKQRMAKGFAKEKDSQCIELADQLKAEKRKVEELVQKTLELEIQLKALRDQFHHRTGTQESKPDHALATAECGLKQRPDMYGNVLGRGHSQHGTQQNGDVQLESQQNHLPDIATCLPTSCSEANKESQKTSFGLPRRRSNPRLASVRAKTNDDTWNQSAGSSSLTMGNTVEITKAVMSSKVNQPVTNGMDLSPLKSLNINVLPTDTRVRRDSAQPCPPDEQFAREPLIRQEVIRTPKEIAQPKASLAHFPSSRLSSPERKCQMPAEERVSPPILNAPAVEGMPAPLQVVSSSSPFDSTPALSLPAGTVKNSYFDRMQQAEGDSHESTTQKEGHSAKAQLPMDNVKPTAAWNAINAPSAGKRNTSIADRIPKDISIDRIEAARARMAARGRVISGGRYS